MLIIRGINVFPSQIESVILEMKEFEAQYQLIVDRKGNLDTLDIKVEVKQEYMTDDLNAMMALKKQLSNRLKSVLSISAEIHFVEPGSIERSQGKSSRTIDKRMLK
jgi:phenylacetate-CoA ligase